MMKLQTLVDTGTSRVRISYDDKILVIGSCFADNIGAKMQQAGFDVMVNPFGTLYNPMSIYRSLQRLESAEHFTQEDCVEMGAGAGLTCSFWHHTSFARKTAGEFLENANARLNEAVSFYRECNKIIITFGTAWVYRHESGEIVSNCLKRNAKEFTRERMEVSEIASLYRPLLAGNKEFIFTVSPIRHFKDGAHGNQLSKSTLLLAIDQILKDSGEQKADYFPSYEIVLDELRDYRFYAEDMIHPSPVAVNYIWERFADATVSEAGHAKIIQKEKEWRRSCHRQMHG